MSFGLRNGVVIAVPIPDSEAAAGSIIEQAIKQALKDARSVDLLSCNN
jgi:pseudouridine-5'-phosphate glycosidase